ncbi:MAG: lipopolysaccharide heptosyltransferase family protein [Caulobacteraceae bacterium]|nr:lipopolysaccharide heptosyltransferase family protein [Caulobacteraceae bacterium]
MHLIERYATACGVKIDKPYIYDTYYPLSVEKYISFQPFSKYPSKNYDYWDEVVAIISPFLQQNNITLVHIGAKDDKAINNTLNLCGQTNISQAAYIIKNSIMHIGADSFAAHIASGYGKKIVALYSNNNINNVKPYWTKPEDMILLSPKINKKPQYSVNEIPKSINNIKPENIAEGILKLLNIKYINLPKTVYIGNEYINKTLEIIPDKPINPAQIGLDTLIIRMDYIFNEQVLELFLQQKKCIIFTNKPINEELLKKYKQNISQLIYLIEKNNDTTFAKTLKRNTINSAFISYLSEEELNEFKLDYMDYGLIVKRDYPKDKIETNNNIYFKSSRILISSEGQFNTKYQWETKDMSNKYINHPELNKELDNLYIFNLDQ